MSEIPFLFGRQSHSPITKEIRDGWREVIRGLLEVVIEQCEEIHRECEASLGGMSFYVTDDGESEYDDVEPVREISRDESHALSLQGMMESQLSCLDDLFNGSMSGHYSCPDDN